MKKAGSRWELNPGHLWLELLVLCHWARPAGQPPFIYTAQVVWYWMPQSHTWQPLSMCPISLVCLETVYPLGWSNWARLISFSLLLGGGCSATISSYLVITFPHAAATRQTDEEELSTPILKLINLIALTDKQWNAGPLLPSGDKCWSRTKQNCLPFIQKPAEKPVTEMTTCDPLVHSKVV